MIDLEKIRKKTLSLLALKNITIDYELPLLDLPESLRSGSEIGNRINILHILYAIHLNGKKSANFFYDVIKKEKVDKYLSKKEKQALTSIWGVSKQNMIDFSWKKESILPLLWSCSVANDDLLYDFEKEIDLSIFYTQIPPEIKLDTFIHRLKLRDLESVLQGLDFYYILHCVASHQDIKTAMDNKQMQMSLIIERCRALEWIIDPNTSWDDISLDT